MWNSQWRRKVAMVGMVAAVSGSAVPAVAADQFIPLPAIRTGPIAPIGTGIFGGFIDYMTLLNQRDGGINGVKLVWEECETEYKLDRGVECYERFKTKGGATVLSSYHTGVTYALTERAKADKFPLVAVGSGRTDSSDGRVFPYVFPLVSNYLSEHVAIVNYLAQREGGFDKLKDKKIAHVYLGIAASKESIPLMDKQAKQYGFEIHNIELALPGAEQQAQWLQVRQIRPDWVILRTAGVAGPAALKTAQKVGYPLDRIVGWWWAGAEEDVVGVGEGAKGYISTTLGPSETTFPLIQEIIKQFYSGGKKGGMEDPKRVGSSYYNRGIVHAIIVTEAIRVAQGKFGKKPLNGEQIQWGLEHVTLDNARLRELGALGLAQPMKLSCENHEGGGAVKFQQWDGKKWVVISDWIPSDPAVVRPIIEEQSLKYAKEKNVELRDCSKEK